MPDLDFLILAQFARIESNKLDILGGTVDTFSAPQFPFAASVGLGMRLLLTRAECERMHYLEVLFQGEDGQRLGEFKAQIDPQPEIPGTPVHWKIGMLAAFNVPLVFPSPGNFSLELMVDDNSKKSIPLRALVPPAV